ncbi:hypothetical protein BLNAU_7220 [Blattamonas nauphoetae]|uniref:Uncharacterized protein n=1 Tax=Blattamonas nauphoetae TaxID=2049346 RepID=A0ABQ9Y230_9EUKA|nr:hypothetical protein BLNAU_7220 [Blattamonas nauphoetae]
MGNSSFFVRYRLVESDLVTKVDWKKHGSEVVQSGKRMIKALLSEGFEDTLEQTLKHDKSEYSGFRLVDECHAISQYLGVNVTRPQ